VQPPYVLTIGGSDSSGAAGIQADLKTFAAHRVYGLSALTLVTAQNSGGIVSSRVLEPAFVVDQIRALNGLDIKAIKTGLLLREETIRAIMAALSDYHGPLIVDPVLVAGDGRQLVDSAGISAYEKLFAKAVLITPNSHEASLLTGFTMTDPDSIKAAADKLYQYGCHVLLKGGASGTDLYFDGHDFHELHSESLSSHNPRGAGDTYSAAIAAELALGRDMLTAVTRAKRYVTQAIRAGLAWPYAKGERGLLWHLPAKPDQDAEA
jgi:hydroxymethylpyrimidine/phosphomethylpyrimidine kinase